MKTRKEVVEFIIKDINEINRKKWEKHRLHSIGVIEIRALLDYIYDGPPKSKEEMLSPKDFKGGL